MFSKRSFLPVVGLFVLASVLLLARTITADAQTLSPTAPTKATPTPMPEPLVYKYVLIDNPQITVGTQIDFIYVGGQLAIRWEQRIGNGFVEHVARFENLEINFSEVNDLSSKGTKDRLPVAGDRGVVKYYWDWKDASGGWDEDGVAEMMFVEEYRRWTPTEVFILGLRDDFAREAENRGFVMEGFASDCVPDHYLVDGVPSYGPYGGTYVVPLGGSLQSVFKPHTLCNDGDKDIIVPLFPANPGDLVVNGGSVPLGGLEIGDFCRMLKGHRPQWQTDKVFPLAVTEKCDLHNVREQTAEATLSRLGFMEMKGSYVDAPTQGWAAYVWWEKDRPFEVELPAHSWKSVPEMKLPNGGFYTVTVTMRGQEASLGIALWDGDRGNDIYGSDTVYAPWDRPIVFVPPGNTAALFKWKETVVYRVVRSGWDEATIQQIVWQ